MARRSNKLNAEPADVPYDGLEYVDVGLAGIAPASRNLPQAQRTTQKTFQFCIKRRSKLQFLIGSDHQMLALPHRQTILFFVFNGSLGARFDAVGAEQAPSQVDRGAIGNGYGLCRAGVGTLAASVGAFGSVYDRATAEIDGQFRRRAIRIVNGLISLFEASDKNVQHG